MLIEFIAAAGRQWTLNSLALYRLHGLAIDHATRVMMLQARMSTAYLQLGTDHTGSLRNLDDPELLMDQIQRHQRAIEDLSRRLSRESVDLNESLQHDLARETRLEARDNVICFATALRNRARNQHSS